MILTEKQERLFWNKINKHGPYIPRLWSRCWIWTGGTNHKGYGIYRYLVSPHKYKIVNAHRMAFQLTKGVISKNKLVCHHCDNPPCCNPMHLFAGTRSDNQKDMWRKNRGRVPIGEEHVRHKLTEQDVIEIRSSKLTNQTLADLYNVGKSTIGFVKRRESWKHL